MNDSQPKEEVTAPVNPTGEPVAQQAMIPQRSKRVSKQSHLELKFLDPYYAFQPAMRRSRSNRKRRRRSQSQRRTKSQRNPKGSASQRRNGALINADEDLESGNGQIGGQGGQLMRQGSGLHHSNKWRGKVTFWNDLEATYFQKLDSTKISQVIDNVREQDETRQSFSQKSFISQYEAIENKLNTWLSRNLDEFFSYYSYYQDVLNELQDNCNYEDDAEVAILRGAQILDQHVKIVKPKEREIQPLGLVAAGSHDQSQFEDDSTGNFDLLGYKFMAGTENADYTTDYFFNQMSGKQPSKEIDDQLEWLEKELAAVEKQVDRNVVVLQDKIRLKQKQEERKENHLNSKSNQKRLSLHMAQTVCSMSIMQVAESIIRVSAIRRGPKLRQADLQNNDLGHIPYMLRKPYAELVADFSKSPQNFPLNGKEFLLTFDETVGLQDLWVDAALFYLLNQLRIDMSRRQNYGRGLPIQLSVGYQARASMDINFDIDRKPIQNNSSSSVSRASSKKHLSSSTVACEKPVKEDQSNIYSELDLKELQSLQVKYGHEADNLQFCHHCKQFKRKEIFAKCTFNSVKHKMNYPASTQVNGVKIFNAGGHLTKLMDCLLLKKLVKDKKRRKTYEEQIQLTCKQQYCSLCLKNFYDISVEEVQANQDWICPFCTGACFCTRCRRQDQMTFAIAYLISLNLNLLLYTPDSSLKVFNQEYQKSSNPIDNFMKQNFMRIVKTCDLSPTGQARLSAQDQSLGLGTLNEQALSCQKSGHGRHLTNYFMDSSKSTSNHINDVMSRCHSESLTSSKKDQTGFSKPRKKTSKKNKGSAKNPEQVTNLSDQARGQPQTEEEKQSSRMRKRLFHEFKSLMSEERNFCRSSQTTASVQIQDILSSGLDKPSGGIVPGLVSDQKQMIKFEEWELLQDFGETHKSLTSANVKIPKSARAKLQKKLGNAAEKVGISDFKAPNNRQVNNILNIEEEFVQPCVSSLGQSKSRTSRGKISKNQVSQIKSVLNMQSSPKIAAQSETNKDVPSLVPIQSHHSTGSTSPSQLSKLTIPKTISSKHVMAAPSGLVSNSVPRVTKSINMSQSQISLAPKEPSSATAEPQIAETTNIAVDKPEQADAKMD